MPCLELGRTHLENVADERVGRQSVDGATVTQVDLLAARRTREALAAGRVSLQTPSAESVQAGQHARLLAPVQAQRTVGRLAGRVGVRKR